MNLEDFEYKKSGRGYKVLVSCVNCQEEWWEKWSAVKDGGKNYCSYDCHNESRRSGVLDGYVTRVVHDGKRNNKEVKVFCGYCGQETWQRWGRVKQKVEARKSFFCSLQCAGKYNTENASQVGKENAGFSWSKSENRWIAYWVDEQTYNKKHTTKAKWLWEMNHGEVPEGYVVTYKDRNPENCELENLEIITRGERTSEALMGHEVSEETRIKISKAHTGKDRWEGFATESNYPGLSKRRKTKVKERDGYECQICEDDLYYSQRAIVHHIDGDKTNQYWDNLIVVCRSCHALIHSKKRVPEEVLAFRSLLKY